MKKEKHLHKHLSEVLKMDLKTRHMKKKDKDHFFQNVNLEMGNKLDPREIKFFEGLDEVSGSIKFV